MPTDALRRDVKNQLRVTWDLSNAGLEVDRYAPALGKVENGVSPKTTLLQRVRAAPVPDGYAAAYNRWRSALEHLPYMRLMTLRITGRLIVGLGTASVLETGITLSRAWGMPYIPGTAIKGLASHTVAQEFCLIEALKAQRERAQRDPAGRTPEPEAIPRPGTEQRARLRAHNELFGTTAAAGYVTWFDAWWIPPEGDCKPFRREVMTVHHQQYYRNRGQHGTAPTDFDDPNPVSYLTATGDFLVAIQAPDTAWGERIEDILRFAFQHRGVGAKTSSGYGRGELTFEYAWIPPAEPPEVGQP